MDVWHGDGLECFLGANHSPALSVASPQMDLLQEFYETTLEALKDAKNDRLWFKTNTKVSFELPAADKWQLHRCLSLSCSAFRLL